VGDLLPELAGRELTPHLSSMSMTGDDKRLPAWLFGLIVAVLVFALVLIVFEVLGVGDDPVVDSLAETLG